MSKTKPLSLLFISGPNLQLLGRREPEVYGHDTLEDLYTRAKARAAERGAALETRQTNHEGTIVDWIGEAPGTFDGILINPGAYTHTSIAIHDAIAGVGLPTIEVHLSNVHAREAFRRHSAVAPACLGVIMGLRGDGYVLAVDALVNHLERHAKR
jgi:3-dehydroquinate dehydratase-2